MAETHTIPGTQVVVKPANPVAVGFLSLTGVYIPFFWYRVNRELKELGEARGIDLGSAPLVSALAMFPGGILVVPSFWTAFTTSERVKNAQIYTGRKDWFEGWIAVLVLLMLPPMVFGIVQDQINKVWQNLGLPTPYEKQVLPPPAPGGYYAGQPYGQPGYGAPPPPPPGSPPPPPAA